MPENQTPDQNPDTTRPDQREARDQTPDTEDGTTVTDEELAPGQTEIEPGRGDRRS